MLGDEDRADRSDEEAEEEAGLLRCGDARLIGLFLHAQGIQNSKKFSGSR